MWVPVTRRPPPQIVYKNEYIYFMRHGGAGTICLLPPVLFTPLWRFTTHIACRVLAAKGRFNTNFSVTRPPALTEIPASGGAVRASCEAAGVFAMSLGWGEGETWGVPGRGVDQPRAGR